MAHGWRIAIPHPFPTSRDLSIIASSYRVKMNAGDDDDSEDQDVDLANLDEVLATKYSAVHLISDGQADKPALLFQLARLFENRFQIMGDHADFIKAILSAQRAIDLLPDGHVDKPDWMFDVGQLYESHFQTTGNPTDLDEAISAKQRAVDLLPDGHAFKPSWYIDLGDLFQNRFGITSSISDLNDAILSQQTALHLTPENHADIPNQWNNLGYSFQMQFERTGDLTNLDQAILAHRKAVQLAPEGHEDLHASLSNLGFALQSRFQRTGHLSDLDLAISTKQRALDLTPHDEVDLPEWFFELGSSFEKRFERTSHITDINEAIAMKGRAVNLITENHVGMPKFLNNLGTSFQTRFEHLGNPSDINEAVSAHRRSVKLTSSGHPRLPSRLNNLANSFEIRFKRSGDLADINEAISAQQRAVNITTIGDASMPGRLGNLGYFFETRFQRTDDLRDINEAISIQQRGVDLIPQGHAEMANWLSNLGCSFQSRFERNGDLADLIQAISTKQEAVDLTPDGNPDMPIRLNNLAAAFESRFGQTKDLSDLDKAISVQRKVVDLTPAGHPTMSQRLNNLGSSFLSRYKITGDLSDINLATAAHQSAVELTPEGHSGLPVRLGNLGTISSYRLASTHPTGAPSRKLSTAAQWASCCSRNSDHPQAMEAYTVAIDLLPQVAGMEQTIQKRHENLISISSLSNQAAAAAFSCGRLESALEWLEHGRCLVWNQLNNLRTPLNELRAYNRALADRILEVSSALENAGSRSDLIPDNTGRDMAQQILLQDEVTTHVKLAQEWEELLKTVRESHGFHSFLRPPSCTDLLSCVPLKGFVIIINVHMDRCDALALSSGATAPIQVPLDSFSHKKADALRRRLNGYLSSHGVRMRDAESGSRGGRVVERSTKESFIHEVLRELWIHVVKPVLDCLGLERKQSSSETPRIWWCATGPLAFLPIHAAGLYGSKYNGGASCVSDFAVSSYTPTVSALLERVNTIRTIDNRARGLLLISQPNSPGLPKIPGTTKEVHAVCERLRAGKTACLCLEGEVGSIDRVTKEIEAYSCIHLACHAIQEIQNPLSSGFFLHDGRLELSEIIKKKLPNADLAFLSACQTSKGDERLSEEAVHLAAGMLAAGYRGVVATMWSIQDYYGPVITGEFYGVLASHGRGDGEEGRLSSEHAAYALHFATKRMRETLGDSESSLLVWVPYVHMGL
ncbi:CHAT domain-containing protein [Crassisporium funariophilum]|nr:CHAT domain-containing protein [Crassisporium funariophilum]